MITYEITTDVPARLVDAYERYMREDHIPALLGTGCFRAASFARSGPGRYRVRYEAATRADLDRYLEMHAQALRDEFAARFPEGVAVSREVWTTVERWDSRPHPG